MQDVSQINQVPVLKRALERLVLRVKHMLSVNNCQRAFWMGNLKNKTLKVRGCMACGWVFVHVSVCAKERGRRERVYVCVLMGAGLPSRTHFLGGMHVCVGVCVCVGMSQCASVCMKERVR